MKRRNKHSLCIYCGTSPGHTSDHIPPKGLFSKPRPSNLATVPCCERCRRTQQTDDDYFLRALITRIEASINPEARQLLQNVESAMRRPESRAFTVDWLGSMTQVDLLSSGGIYLGESYVQKADVRRLGNVVERTTKGLFYRQFSCRLPDSHMVKVIPIDCLASADAGLRSLVWEYVNFALAGRRAAFGQNAYVYWVNTNEGNGPLSESFQTFWFHLFYQTTAFLAGTHSKSLIDEPCSPDQRPAN